MTKNNTLYKRLNELLDEGLIALAKDKSDTLYAKIYISGKLAGMEAVGSSRFVPLFKELYMERYNDFLDNQSMQIILEMLAMEGRRVTKKVNLSKRIHRTKNVYLYELEAETNKVVWIEDGEISIEYLDEIYFKHSPTEDSQVEPDLSSGARNLMSLLYRHFKFKSDDDMKLFALYLVSCFLGLEKIRAPILVFFGAKGASKSTAMRMLSKLVSPQKGDLGGQFNNLDDLQLSIADSYMVTLDNMRTISKKCSDLLCRVCSGGSYRKRKLYTDGDMLNYDLNCIIVISSITMPIKEPDLVDRSIVLELERIDAKKRKSESEIWKRFDKDIPAILGSIFNIIAQVLQDDEPIENTDYIRLVDFHQACIRIGRVIGIKERKVNELLRHHRNNVNETLICDDIAVGCFVEYMRRTKNFVGSVTELLNKLYEIADSKEISYNDMPKSANHLSRRLNRVKSNLEESYDIYYEISNTGAYRQIYAEIKKNYN